MSSDVESGSARAPKRERGKQRVAELLEAATAVFAEKGYEAATMTEIAARADAPIGSLYQFFPTKGALADTLVREYAALLLGDLQALEARAAELSLQALVDGLFGLLRGRPRERAAALPLAEARMDEQARRTTFRHMLRKNIAAIFKARTPGLSSEAARDMAIVMVQLMKAASSLSDEDGLAGRAGALRELQALAVSYLEQRPGT
ncbi:MAG: TetR/AcrR family transcriptional regulator [Nevskia sp.]|nr:TetR/AcrR family transcriptional regulator [Nevskia sp.]